MKRPLFLTIITLAWFGIMSQRMGVQVAQASWWQIQSVDTMKYSRDLSRQILEKPEQFAPTIAMQVSDIAKTGATHVSIATPYDEEFLPVLSRWVAEARKHGLQVWFRGNFSGWEGWFGYKSISREQHLQLTRELIRSHPELFEAGDIFSPCPECENGGPGDPRFATDVESYRKFLIDLYTVSREGFHSIGKNVQTNIHSMNGDVARLVMDEATTKALGGIVTVDHYVADPDQLVEDVKEYARKSGGKVVLGEFGAPIPDIHGSMSEAAQAEWIDKSLSRLSLVPELVGINYWVNVGGSTALWNDGGSARKAVNVLTAYYTPKAVSGKVTDERGRPLQGVLVRSDLKTVRTDAQGIFAIPYLGEGVWLQFELQGYKNYSIQASGDQLAGPIALEPSAIGPLRWIIYRLHLLFPRYF